MSKKRFIQAVFARTVPPPAKFVDGLEYAEKLWAFLTQHGYGDDKPSEPRKGEDYYQALAPRPRRFFDGFWLAFAHKYGRNNAARRWLQMGELSDDDYQKIIDAAVIEARRELAPGQVRKMAEGWLHEKRWQDFAPTQTHAKNAINLAIERMANDLKGIKQLYAQSQDPKLLPQIEKLEAAIKEARKQ
jgi:hypothetical protein